MVSGSSLGRSIVWSWLRVSGNILGGSWASMCCGTWNSVLFGPTRSLACAEGAGITEVAWLGVDDFEGEYWILE